MGLFTDSTNTNDPNGDGNSFSFTSQPQQLPFDFFNPSVARLNAAGLQAGGYASQPKTETVFGFTSGSTTSAADQDWRVRVSLADGADFFYKSVNPGVMGPLLETKGVIFPYTPSITMNYTARYSEQKLTHSNYSSFFYDGSEVSTVNISGDFSVQSLADGQYLLACIYFFRSLTKMFFGKDAKAGNPPPIIFLDGYGSHYFPHVPCVVTSFQHTMPPDVDYVNIPATVATQPTSYLDSYLSNTGTATPMTPMTRLPTMSSIQIALQPVYSRSNVHNNFSLDKFAAGQLIKGYGGFI